MHRPVSLARAAAVAATALAVAAIAGFGAMSPAFSQRLHPVAALGASGVPHAMAFDLLGFVIPGLLAAYATIALRARMAQARYVARLGANMLTLAALAYAAMGVLPLDSRDLLSAPSRAHAVAWTVWWVAFAAGAGMLAVGMRGTPHASRSMQVAACAALALVFALLLPGIVPVGIAQRVAFGAWFVATLVLAPSRDATSAPGSSPTGPA